MMGVSTDCLTAAIISGDTGFNAPEPASKYVNFNPNISPAMAVQAAIPGLSCGIGFVLEI